MVVYNTQSAANNLAVESGDMYSGRGKSKGPSTLPYGTPDCTEADDEAAPSSRTCCDLSPTVLCFQHPSGSRVFAFFFFFFFCLLDALHRRSEFTNFCHDLMQNHLT